MVKQDYVHLAEVCMSIHPKMIDDDEFDGVIRRFIWAMRASPVVQEFDDNDFREMAYGRKPFEDE